MHAIFQPDTVFMSVTLYRYLRISSKTVHACLQLCPAGTHTDKQTGDRCLNCDPGFFNFDGNECLACPIGASDMMQPRNIHSDVWVRCGQQSVATCDVNCESQQHASVQV